MSRIVDFEELKVLRALEPMPRALMRLVFACKRLTVRYQGDPTFDEIREALKDFDKEIGR